MATDYKATIAKLRDEKRKLKADLQAAKAQKKSGGGSKAAVQKARDAKNMKKAGFEFHFHHD